MSTISQHSPAFLRKRRFYVALPILIIPFITLLFWVLGGGSGNQASAQPALTSGGLNLSLPSAKLKDDSHLTKLDYYKQADADSARRLTQIKNDPYYKLPTLTVATSDTVSSVLLNHETPDKKNAAPTKYLPPAGRSVFSPAMSTDPNETKVYQKLAALDAQLNKNAPTTTSKKLSGYTVTKPASLPSPASPDVDRVENLLHALHAKDTSTDPEMQQLSGMLDKLMTIQHPENVIPEKSKGIPGEHKGQVYAVSVPEENNVSILAAIPVADSDNTMLVARNAFYSLDDNSSVDQPTNTLSAVIHETQRIVTGATVQLRLTQDITINGMVIPEDNFLFGKAQLSGDRLSIAISSISFHNYVLPVSLSVYGLDGLPGIPIQGSMTTDVARQSADQSISSMGITSLDQSIGAQAANAGIQTVKTLVSKKVKLVQVTLPGGYQVLLKDNNQKQL